MSEPGDKTKDISDIQPDRLIKYRVSDDRFSAEVLLPGLWYTDFDKKIGGKVSFWSLAMLFENFRYLIYQSLMESALKSGSEETFSPMFLVASLYKFSSDVHNIRESNTWGRKRPVYLKSGVTHVGQTSITSETDMTDVTSGKWLGSMMSKMVAVDMYTRKPTKLTEELLKKRGTIQQERTIAKPKEDVQVPVSSAFKYKTRAAYSDLDDNMHVNQGVYIRWCVDAACCAAIGGHYRDFNEHIGWYPLAEMEVHYLSESMEEDDIEIYTWQDEEEEKTLRFLVTKTGAPIVLVRFSFHSIERSNVSKL